MLSRRHLLQGSAIAAGSTMGLGSYALAEPQRLTVKHIRVSPPDWPEGLRLNIALLADFHVCDPWMSVDRISAIVERTNQLAPDAVLLLGDYAPGRRLLRFARPIAGRDWATALAALRAPFGVHAVLGNHDWWDDHDAQLLRRGPPAAGRALEAAGIPVYENTATRWIKSGQPFWIAGLGDQAAFEPRAWARPTSPFGATRHGAHDLRGTLNRITDDAPVIMMAHEPDIFASMPARVALTVCGHTHGGQVRLPGVRPYVPSSCGTRYLSGHIVEDGRQLVVSNGLGCSGIPVRFGVPPEIVIVELSAWSAVGHS